MTDGLYIFESDYYVVEGEYRTTAWSTLPRVVTADKVFQSFYLEVEVKAKLLIPKELM